MILCDMSEDDLLVGDYNELEVVKFVDFGLYLRAGYREILLPKREIPPGTTVGEILTVFIYKDSENRLIATTAKPKIRIHECAYLEVKEVNNYGAFLDWGISNQLLVPYREQPLPMKAGEKYMVYLYLDEVSDRLVATMRVEKHLMKNPIHLAEKEEVDLYIYQKTPIGYKAIINQQNIGLLYESELDRKVKVGQQLTGYVSKIREDLKIDLTLKKPGFERVLSHQDFILGELKKHKNFLPLHDKSSPDEIRELLKMSKSDFKKSIGILYKQKKILIKEDGIYLLP